MAKYTLTHDADGDLEIFGIIRTRNGERTRLADISLSSRTGLSPWLTILPRVENVMISLALQWAFMRVDMSFSIGPPKRELRCSECCMRPWIFQGISS